MERQYFDCKCTHFDHVVRFTLDDESGDLWIEVRLNDLLPWWKRLGVACSYVLGTGSQFGHFAEMQLPPEDFNRLRSMLVGPHTALKQFSRLLGG